MLIAKLRSPHSLAILIGVVFTFFFSFFISSDNQVLLVGLAIIGTFLLWLFLDFKIACYFVILSSTIIRLQFEFPNPLMQPSIFMMIIGLGSVTVFLILKKAKLYITVETVLFALLISYTLLISFYKSPVWTHSFDGIVQLTLAFLGFFVITQARNLDIDTISRFIKFVVIVGLMQAVYSIISLSLYSTVGLNIGGLMFNQFGTSVTVQGTMFEANLFGSFTGLCLLILVTMFLTGYIKKHRLFWGVAAILLFVGLILSWTRSAWIGFALGILLVGFIYLKNVFTPKTIFLMTAIILIIVPILLVIQLQFDKLSGESGLFTSKLTNIFDNDSGTGKYRTDQFKFALNDLRGDEIIGKGYYSIKKYGDKEWISNIFIFFYHDTGLIGLTMLVLLLISALRKAFKAIVVSTGTNKMFMVGSTAGLILLLFSYNFTPGHVLSVFWVYLGLVVTLASMIINESSHTKKASQ